MKYNSAAIVFLQDLITRAYQYIEECVKYNHYISMVGFIESYQAEQELEEERRAEYEADDSPMPPVEEKVNAQLWKKRPREQLKKPK